MKHPYQLVNTTAIKDFVTAGHATVTLKSKRTGEHFTYRIMLVREAKTGKPVEPKRLRVSVLIDRDKYSPVGEITDDAAFISRPAARTNPLSVKGFEWFWWKLPGREGQTTEKGEALLAEKIEVWHEGQCGRCGRPLTHPESIKNGIGPECAQRMAVEGLLDEIL